MKSNISFSNLLKVSWNLVKAHPVPVIGFFCLYLCILIALAVFSQSGSVGGILLYNAFSYFGQAIFFIFYMGMLFNIVDGKRIDDFQNGWTKFTTILIVYILMALGMVVLMILIFSPFWGYVAIMQIDAFKLLSSTVWIIYFIGAFIFVCYFYLRLSCTLYIVVDHNKGVLDSLELSWRITKGRVCRIWLMMLLQIGLIIGGALCLLVGLFVAMPLCVVMMMFFYRGLLNSNSLASDVIETLPEDTKFL